MGIVIDYRGHEFFTHVDAQVYLCKLANYSIIKLVLLWKKFTKIYFNRNTFKFFTSLQCGLILHLCTDYLSARIFLCFSPYTKCRIFHFILMDKIFYRTYLYKYATPRYIAWKPFLISNFQRYMYKQTLLCIFMIFFL